MVGITAAILVCVAAWLWLVRAAIGFGGLVGEGMTEAWVPLITAGLGAVTCLVVALMLGLRLADALRRPMPPRHRR